MEKFRKSIMYVLIAALILSFIPPTFMSSVANAAASAVKLVIQPKQVYQSVYFFYDGMSRVSMNKKFGFVDSTGKEVIPLKYESASSFSEGMAAVKLNGKTGFIDKKGKTIVAFKYQSATDFSVGLASVQLNGKWGLVNKAGKEIVKPKYDEPIWFGNSDVATVYINGKAGAVNKAGKEIVAPKYGSLYSVGEGMIGIQDKYKYGLIDSTGKQVLAPQYQYITSFNEGVAAVSSDEKYGLIDKNGKVLVAPKYESIATMSQGLAAASKDGKYGYIDKTGKEVIPFEYDYASTFENGNATASKDDKYIIIDKTGKQVDANQYDYIADYTWFGMRSAILNGKSGIIKSNGEFISLNYKSVRILSDSLLCVTDNSGKRGCVDLNGKVIIQPKYDSISVANKYLVMSIDTNYTVADKTGKTIGSFQCDYPMIANDSDLVFWVYNGNKVSLVKLP